MSSAIPSLHDQDPSPMCLLETESMDGRLVSSSSVGLLLSSARSCKRHASPRCCSTLRWTADLLRLCCQPALVGPLVLAGPGGRRTMPKAPTTGILAALQSCRASPRGLVSVRHARPSSVEAQSAQVQEQCLGGRSQPTQPRDSVCQYQRQVTSVGV